MTVLATIVEFLRGIGIPVREGTVGDAFLPGVRIEQGGLVYDPGSLRWPGDLLHEAGHLAVVPAAMRASMSDDLAAIGDVEHAGELEAMAWAWAALVHLGLPATVLFHEGGYHGQSAGLITTYGLGVYPGAHGLAQAGLARTGPHAPGEPPPYPALQRWLRE